MADHWIKLKHCTLKCNKFLLKLIEYTSNKRPYLPFTNLQKLTSSIPELKL